MATRLELNKSLNGGSEEAFDKQCSFCLEDGLSKDAVKYCVDCAKYLCEQCVKQHDMFSKEHQVTDRCGPGEADARKALPIDRCYTHHGKLLDMYCNDHGAVCCVACIAISHRACVKVDYLPEVACGIRESQEYIYTTERIGKIGAKLHEKKVKGLKIIASLDDEKETILQEINSLEEELKLKISELAAKAREGIQTAYLLCRKDQGKAVASLDKALTDISTVKETLTDNNETRLFVNVKSATLMVKEGGSLLSNVANTIRWQKLTFVQDANVVKIFNSVESLGSVKLVSEPSNIPEKSVSHYTANFAGKYKIKANACKITAVCMVDKYVMVVVEGKSKSLMRVNTSNFTKIDELSLDNISYSVCCTGSMEVAVALYEKKKVQFVSVAEKMTPTKYFSTEHCANAVVYNEISRQLYVSSNSNRVTVYDRNGCVLKTILTDNKGMNIFVRSDQMAFNNDKSCLYITDNGRGLIALDLTVEPRWILSDKELSAVRGMCVLPGEIILVSGYFSNNVMQVDRHGKAISTLLGRGENLKKPWTLAYDRHTSR